MSSSQITIVQPNLDGSLPIPAPPEPPEPGAADQAQAQLRQQAEALQQVHVYDSVFGKTNATRRGGVQVGVAPPPGIEPVTAP